MCHMMIFFTTLIFSKISFVSSLQKILYTQKFRVFKRAKNTRLKICCDFEFESPFSYLCMLLAISQTFSQ